MTLKLNGSSSGSVSIDAPASTTGGADVTLTLPEKGFGFTSYALIYDQKSQNTGGGTFTAGAWQHRDLNTEGYDPDGIVSISSNDFTLAAGSYLIKWSAPAFQVERHMARLYDVTGTATISPYGTSEHSGAADVTSNMSIGSARVTPSGSNAYRIVHRCETTNTTYGFGITSNLDVEMYTRVEIYKEA